MGEPRMDDDMDDFGDLYGDLEDRVNAGIFRVQENQYSSSAERNMSSPKPGEFDSISEELSEEHSSDDRIGEANERAVSSNGGNESLAFGAQESGNSSDSEDDLHIVLNEDDRLKSAPSQRENLGSGGAAVGEGEGEKEDEDLVILYGPDGLQKTHKWGDQLLSPTDGMVQGSTERGGAEKGSYYSCYVGSDQGRISYNGKNSISARGVWDQLMMPSSGGTASCSLSIPASAQNGYGFTLPRNRTIFDISIEAFEQKPWRRPGADITDYFNFGLDEDSWKSYFQQLDQCRQQATMFTQFPFYKLSRQNQVLESDLGSPKAMLTKAAQWEQKKKSFLHMENVERRLMGLQMPKGRAIQVESGVGERIPSADIRQPRHRDSDVVIQIAMGGSMENVSVPCEGELKHAEQGHGDCSMLEYENEPNEGMWSLDYDGQGCWETTDPLVRFYPEVAETNLKGAADEVKDKLYYSKDESEDSLRVDDSLMEVEIASGVQVMHSLSSGDLDSHSGAFKDDGCLKKIHAAIRKTSLDSGTAMQESVRSDCYLSNDSGINATKTEIEDIKRNTCDCCLSPEGHNGCSRSGHNVISELNIPADNEQASSQFPRKSQNDVDPFEVSYGIGESKCDHSTDIRGHLSSNKETKMSVSYKSRKYAEKRDSEKSSSKSYHKKGDHYNHPRINWDKRDCFEQSAAGGDSAIKHREHYSREWHHDDRRERVVRHEHSDESISECGSIFLGKDSSLRHKKDRENEHLIRTDAVNYEKRCREKHVQEMHRRHIARCDREEGIFDHRFRRAAPCSGREERALERRDNYDRSSCFDLYGSNKYNEYDAKRLRHLDGRLLDSQMYEHHFEDERGWHDASPLRNHLCRSCRSHEKFVDHRKHFAIREIESRYEKYECCFVPSSKDCHHSSYENNDNKFHDDEHITEERGTYVDGIVREKRYGRLAKPRPDTDDKVSFKHGDPNLSSREESFLCERSSRNEKSLVKHHLVGGRKFSDDCRLSNARKELVNERTQRSSASEAREHGKFVLHNFDKGRHELATLGRSEAVNMHLNGLKRKFHKRGNEFTVASEVHRVVTETIDEKQKDSRHIEEVRLLEVPLHVPKSEGTHNRPASLKERVKELKEHSGDHFLKNCEDKHLISQSNDVDDIEEGQLIEESDDQHVGLTTEYWNPEKKVAFPAVEARRSAHLEEKSTQAKESTPDNKIYGFFDSNRILETLAKMEKRRERFKGPLALKQGPEKTLKPQLELATVTDELKQQRPARKRRWGGMQ